MTGDADLAQLAARAETGDGAAQYALAAQLSRNGDRQGAERWLAAAAAGGFPDALYTLATRKLYRTEDADEAARAIKAAADAGSPPAARLIGVLEATGIGVDLNEAGAVRRIVELARGDDPAALRDVACGLALYDADDPHIAPLLERSLGVDPVGAAFALARARHGRATSGDLSAAEALLGRLQYPRADQLKLNGHPPATTPPFTPDWDAITARLETPLPPLPAATRLSAAPDAIVFRAAVAPEVCEYVIAHAAARLGPSLVYDPTSARMIRDPLRTSATASLGPIDLDLALVAVNRLMATAAGAPLENGEFLSVLHYKPGQEYRPHFDCIPPGADMERSGQRAKTALLYLNTDYQGGETVFTETGLGFRGEQGDILVFSNLLADGALDPKSRHAGAPVSMGTKWLASKWLRTKKFKF